MKGFQWIIAAACLVLGIMLAFQFRIASEINKTEPVQRAQLLASEVNQLKKDRDLLQEQVNSL
ncbi:MAG: hypothetical protein PHP51_05515, partial [Desulfotomaculaceae bacterium]|nr:hypothetical protein [Desulfotomaculaceae bacterium]